MSKPRKKLLTALDYFQAPAQKQERAETMLELGRVAIETTTHEAAHQWLTEAHQSTVALGDDAGTALALYRLARLYRRIEDFASVESYCQQVLLLQDTCDYRTTIRTFRLLAAVEVERESYIQAQSYCQSALILAEQHNNKDERATTLYTALSIAARHKEHEKACQLATESLTLFKQMGSNKLQALTLYELSISHWYQQNYEDTFTLLSEGIHLLKEIKDNFNLVKLLTFKGNVWVKIGEEDKACKVWQTALAIAIPQRHPIITHLRVSLDQHCREKL